MVNILTIMIHNNKLYHNTYLKINLKDIIIYQIILFNNFDYLKNYYKKIFINLKLKTFLYYNELLQFKITL